MKYYKLKTVAFYIFVVTIISFDLKGSEESSENENEGNYSPCCCPDEGKKKGEKNEGENKGENANDKEKGNIEENKEAEKIEENKEKQKEKEEEGGETKKDEEGKEKKKMNKKELQHKWKMFVYRNKMKGKNKK